MNQVEKNRRRTIGVEQIEISQAMLSSTQNFSVW
jgi:hypothetical protein